MGSKLADKGDKKYGASSNDGDPDGDYLYNSMRQVVSEGMNHITKTLMQTSRYDDGAGIIRSEVGEYNADGDLVNSAGELQTVRGQENIPMRPLVINNNNAAYNLSNNRYVSVRITTSNYSIAYCL